MSTIGTTVNQEIFTHFKKTVYSIHGLRKGIILQEIERCISEWMHKETNLQDIKGEPSS